MRRQIRSHIDGQEKLLDGPRGLIGLVDPTVAQPNRVILN
jgi:hypothetical protein